MQATKCIFNNVKVGTTWKHLRGGLTSTLEINNCNRRKAVWIRTGRQTQDGPLLLNSTATSK
jgi:hypothetical protein